MAVWPLVEAMISFDSEKDFEDLLFKHEDFTLESLDIQGAKLFRQVNLGAYGIADLVAVSESPMGYGDEIGLDVYVIELKNTPLSFANVAQLARYKSFFEKAKEHTPRPMEVRGILIGKKTFPTNSDLEYLCQEIEWLTVYEFSLDPRKGIDFDNNWGWHPASIQDDHFTSVLKSVWPEYLNILTVAQIMAEKANG